MLKKRLEWYKEGWQDVQTYLSPNANKDDVVMWMNLLSC